MAIGKARTEMRLLLDRFASAFFRRDLDALERLTTSDFEWRFAIGEDGPHGRVYRGVDGIAEGFGERDAVFESLRYDDVDIMVADRGRAVMTYRVRGRRTDGTDIDADGVEIYNVRDGRIALKDAYWKQTARLAGAGGGKE